MTIDCVQEIGEDSLIQRVCEGLATGERVVVGPGDDCAVIEVGEELPFTLLKTDAVVGEVHFLSETPAEKVGWKAVARVMSDFAAMGGYGCELLVTLAISKETSVEWVDQLYRGMKSCAAQFQTFIVGGETTAVPSGNVPVVTISGRGAVERDKLVTRYGGSPGDVLFVTGRLGGSLAGRHLSFTPRVEEAAWLTEHCLPSAMMDLSDGLARDLPRLALASQCGYQIDHELIPCHAGSSVEEALSDGEDFELLFSVPDTVAKELKKSWPKTFPELSQIGCLLENGTHELKGGWGHFESNI